MTLNTATINFGGINSSKLEFVDFSTEESKSFFQNLQTIFESFESKTSDVDRGFVTLRKYIIDKFSTNEISYINYLFDCSSKFIRENMTHEFICQLDTNSTDQFDIGSVRLGTFMEKVLKRDKGIGGFEQICQSRDTNIGNINQFLKKKPRNKQIFI